MTPDPAAEQIAFRKSGAGKAHRMGSYWLKDGIVTPTGTGCGHSLRGMDEIPLADVEPGDRCRVCWPPFLRTPDPIESLIAAHVAAAHDSGGGVSSSNVSAQAAVEHATPRPRTPHGAEEPTPVCWRSECRNGCYYPDVCSEKPRPQARFDADGLPRGLMPISGIRCGEWL